MPIELVHHDGRSYKDAVSQAAKEARMRMERMLEGGAAKAQAKLHQIERDVPDDYMDAGKDIEFALAEQEGKAAFNLLMQGKYIPADTRVHRHALGQIRAKIGAPDMRYVERMMFGEKVRGKQVPPTKVQQDRIINLLNDHMRKDVGDTRYLVRAVDEEARGFLSDSYKVLHSPSLFNLFVDVAQKNGAVVVGGDGSAIKHTMRAFIPNVFEPIEDEVLCIGVEMLNGDFGDSRYVVRMVVMRLWCTNMATMYEGIQKRHLGGKLPEDAIFSAKTHELATRTLVSASNDVISDMLSPAKVDSVLQAVKQASEASLSWNKAKELIGKYLRKDEMANAEKMYNSTKDDPTGPLPKAKSFYKAAQLLSWQANQAEGDRRIELIEASGKLMDRFLPKAA